MLWEIRTNSIFSYAALEMVGIALENNKNPWHYSPFVHQTHQPTHPPLQVTVT